jgi:hypothetical protein
MLYWNNGEREREQRERETYLPHLNLLRTGWVAYLYIKKMSSILGLNVCLTD